MRFVRLLYESSIELKPFHFLFYRLPELALFSLWDFLHTFGLVKTWRTNPRPASSHRIKSWKSVLELETSPPKFWNRQNMSPQLRWILAWPQK